MKTARTLIVNWVFMVECADVLSSANVVHTEGKLSVARYGSVNGITLHCPSGARDGEQHFPLHETLKAKDI